MDGEGRFRFLCIAYGLLATNWRDQIGRYLYKPGLSWGKFKLSYSLMPSPRQNSDVVSELHDSLEQ